MLARVLTLEVACSIAAIGRNGGAEHPIAIVSRPCALHRIYCFVRRDTYRVEDVVIVTAHTAEVLVAVVRIREPLWGATVTTRARASE